MANEQQEVRQVNWNEVFAFTHIFKSFRMAIHPSKLLLAFAAITLIFMGGWVLDHIWAAGGSYVMQNEIANYARQRPDVVRQQVERWEKGRETQAAGHLTSVQRERIGLTRLQLQDPYLSSAFSKRLTEYNDKQKYDQPDPAKNEKLAKEEGWSAALSDADDVLDDIEKKATKLLKEAYADARKAIKDDQGLQNDEARDQAEEALDRAFARARVSVTEMKVAFAAARKDIRGERISEALLAYEKKCLDEAIEAVFRGDIFSGLRAMRTQMANRRFAPAAVEWQPFPTPNVPGDRPGFFCFVLLACQGVCWLIAEHWVFALIFGVWSLLVLALTGGAVYRIAALHFAREEKISIGQALKFSLSKFFSFLTAPLIPLAIILLVGLLLTVGGLIGSIPVVGEVILGILFFLAIILGLVAAFLIVGLLAGWPLMYPTIAVEGSDSFDAISRSYSYVFARPWRAGLYALVALVYGVATYLFVRLFAYIALASAHSFLKWGMIGGGSSLHPDADKIDVLWRRPTFDNLFTAGNWQAMSGAEPFAAVLIQICVYVVAAMVGAYLLSYFASASTSIYYLLRRKVDATDLDDVYVEDTDEEELPAPAAEPSEKPAEEAPEKETAQPADEQKLADKPAEKPEEQAEEKPAEQEGGEEGEEKPE